MRKMLVADNTEINRSILYGIFASQYELIQTESSETAFRLLTENYILPNSHSVKRFSVRHFFSLWLCFLLSLHFLPL